MTSGIRSAAGTVASAAGAAAGAVGSAASGIGSAASSVGHGAYSAGGAAWNGGSHAYRGARRAYRGASHLGSGVYGGASRVGSGVRRSFSDVLENEPLVLGALGLAVGAAIGALLPRTQVEDRTFGDTSDHLRETAEEFGREKLEQGKAVAEEVYRTAKEKAEETGLTASGEDSLAGKVGEVARATMEKARESAAESRRRPQPERLTGRIFANFRKGRAWSTPFPLSGACARGAASRRPLVRARRGAHH